MESGASSGAAAAVRFTGWSTLTIRLICPCRTGGRPQRWSFWMFDDITAAISAYPCSAVHDLCLSTCAAAPRSTRLLGGAARAQSRHRQSRSACFRNPATRGHRGTVVMNIGDELMCTFPLAHRCRGSGRGHAVWSTVKQAVTLAELGASSRWRSGSRFHAGPVITRGEPTFSATPSMWRPAWWRIPKPGQVLITKARLYASYRKTPTSARSVAFR